MSAPTFVVNDGGRAAAGRHGNGRDCVVRALAIATGIPYRDVANLVYAFAQRERPGARAGRQRGKRSTPWSGVYKGTIQRVCEALGLRWHATMAIGTGCRVHLRAGELPRGRLVVSVSRHLTAVLDGVVHDTHDPSRGGARCVYGYWAVPEVFDPAHALERARAAA